MKWLTVERIVIVLKIVVSLLRSKRDKPKDCDKDNFDESKK